MQVVSEHKTPEGVTKTRASCLNLVDLDHDGVLDVTIGTTTLVGGTAIISLAIWKGGAGLTGNVAADARLDIGGAGRMACAVAALGGEAALAGRIGDDDLGTVLLARLRARGVDCRDLRPLPGLATPFTSILVDAAGSLPPKNKPSGKSYCPPAIACFSLGKPRNAISQAAFK